MSAQETAEAFLLVVKRLAKWLGVGAAGLVALALALWGSFWLYNYVTFERPKSEIEIVVLQDMDKCATKEYPFFVGFVNRSSKTILKYSFKFDVKEKGHSTNLASWESVSDDKVIKPTEGWGGCWRIKSKASTYSRDEWIEKKPDLEVRVIDFRPEFE